MIIDSRIVNTTIRKANQLNYVIEDVEFVLNLAMDEMGRGVDNLEANVGRINSAFFKQKYK